MDPEESSMCLCHLPDDEDYKDEENSIIFPLSVKISGNEGESIIHTLLVKTSRQDEDIADGTLNWLLIEPSTEVILNYILENKIDPNEISNFTFSLNEDSCHFDFTISLFHAFICDDRLDAVKALWEEFSIEGESLFSDPLGSAALNGKYDIFKYFLEEGIKVPPNCPLLHLAVIGKNRGIVKLILDLGRDVNEEHINGGKFSIIPLQLACSKGDIKMVKLLLKRGSNIMNERENAIQPISSACEKGNLEIVKLLLDLGADPNPKIYLDDTYPIEKACYMGRVQIVEELLRRGVLPPENYEVRKEKYRGKIEEVIAKFKFVIKI